MHGFLLDSHVPAAVVEGVRAASTCEIYHLSHWRGGIFRHAPDEDILMAARESELAVVTGDVNTIPAALYRWLEDGVPPGLVVFIPSRMLQAKDVGGIVQGLVDLCPRLRKLDPAYPVVFLRPPA